MRPLVLPLLTAALAAGLPALVRAQTTVSVSREVFALRDIARSGAPADASPVAWRGTGQGLAVSRRWGDTRPRHLVSVSAATAGSFAFDNGIHRTARPATDRFRAIAANYEHRRYPVTDLLLRGFDLGVGVRGGVGHTSWRRTIDGGSTSSESRSAGTAVVVLLARYTSSDRLALEAGWANGGQLARVSDRHSASALSASQRWGGGWVTDLTARMDVGVTRQLSLAVRFDQWDDGQFSSHRQLSTRRHGFGVGVAYAR